MAAKRIKQAKKVPKRSAPRVAQATLHDLTNPAKITRIWERLGQSLASDARYACWLRSATGEVDTWTATSKRAAFDSVRTGVLAGRTEGGVEGSGLHVKFTWLSGTELVTEHG